MTAGPLLSLRRRTSGGRPYRTMVLGYERELRLFPGWFGRAGLLALAVCFWYLPTQQISDAGLRTLSLCGIYALGAIGLNLLAGYTGQVSLGHAFFVGVGAYCAGYLGATHGWPLPAYVAVAVALGFVLGALVGPFALRLRGHYLVIVTLGLVFVGRHLFSNWDSVTGGNRGLAIGGAPTSILGLDFQGLDAFGSRFTADQSFFWLVWALVALGAILAKNLVRSRMGRAMQAVRDDELAAEAVGIDVARVKVGAFAWSSGYASVAGVLTGLLVGRAAPEDFGLFLSINYIAVVIIGGAGTVVGSVLGALFVIGGQEMIRQNSGSSLLEPLLSAGPGDRGWFSVGELNAVLFGIFIILFLLLEPRGLAAFWLRAKRCFLSWPFSN